MAIVHRPDGQAELAAWRLHAIKDGERRLRLPGLPETGLASSGDLSIIGLSGHWLRTPPVRAVLLEEVVLTRALRRSPGPGVFHDDYCMGPSQLLPAPSAAASSWMLGPEDLLLRAPYRDGCITELSQVQLDQLPATSFGSVLARLNSFGRPLRSNLLTLRTGVPYQLALLPSPPEGKIIDALATALVQVCPTWRTALYAAPGTACCLPAINGRLTLVVERCPQGSDWLHRLQALQHCLPNVRIELHYLRHADSPHLHWLHDAAHNPPQLPILEPWPMIRAAGCID